MSELLLGKAPGPDGIRNEVLLRLPDSYLFEQLEQFKFSFSTGFIPTCWLEINTVYIKKSGKPNTESPRTYWPIGLSSCILKLCERLVNWGLKETFLNNGFPKQHAFTLNQQFQRS